MTVRKTGAIQGKVLDAVTHQPIQGVWIKAYFIEPKNPYQVRLLLEQRREEALTLFETYSREDGSFVISNLQEDAETSLFLRAEGYAMVIKSQISAGADNLIFYLEP